MDEPAFLARRQSRRRIVAALAVITSVAGVSLREAYRIADPAAGAAASRAATQLTRLLRRPAVLQRAENIVTARCMRRKGLTYRSPVRAYDPRAPMTLAGRPLGASFARLYGYGFSWGDVRFADRSASARARVFRALAPHGSPEVRVRLPVGYIAAHPRRGCVPRARLIVYGSLRNYLALVYVPQGIRRRLLRHLGAALLRDDVREAASAYAACMREEGYAADTPRGAWLMAWRSFRDDRAISTEQRRMAIADATCQAKSAIYAAISAGLAQEGRRVLIESHAILPRLMSLRDAALTRAREIVLRSTVAIVRKRAG